MKKEKFINQIKLIIFGILVIIEVLIILAIWIALEGELRVLSTIAIILIPILFWLGNKNKPSIVKQ